MCVSFTRFPDIECKSQEIKAILLDIWERPSIKLNNLRLFSIQSLLRIRSNYIEIRTTVSHQLPGLMKEYGVFVAAGYQKLKQELQGIFDRNTGNGLTPQMKELIEGQYGMLLIFDEKIDKLDIQIEQISQQNEVCQRLQQIEGIGPITALAIIALVGNGQGFKNGRHFSAYLGLVPKQYSSDQKAA